MAEEATCMWGMNERARVEALPEERDRLTRIYDALKEAVSSHTGDQGTETSIWTERKVILDDGLGGTIVIEQDAYRVQMGHDGAIGWRWYRNGDFEPIIPRGLAVPVQIVNMVALALGRAV